MDPFLLSWTELLLLALSHLTTFTTNAEAGPKGNPEPWDWQKAYPVFAPYSKSQHELPHKPEFLSTARNVSVIGGETASLPCRVKNLFEHYTVSWIRARDVTVLSVGHLIFSSDQRLSVLEVPRPILDASDWSLTILNVSKVDEGTYECQINTEPKLNKKFHLSVQEEGTQGDSPYYEVMVVDQPVPPMDEYEKTHSKLKKHLDLSHDEGFPMWLHDNGCICPKPQFRQHQSQKKRGGELSISGGPVQYVTEGTDVELECQVSTSSKASQTLHWERRGKTMTVKERAGVSLERETLDGISRTRLYLSGAQLEDTGNYTCVSNNLPSETVLLVVTTDYGSSADVPKAAALTSSSSLLSSPYIFLFFSPLLILTVEKYP